MPRGMSWHDYNDSLVERGRALFDLGFAKNWKRELEAMNGDKKGRPYEFPDSYIEFLSFFRVRLNAQYRVIEGMTEALSEFLRTVEEMHFTQIRRRVLEMAGKKKPERLDRVGEGISDDPLTVVIDSTGLSTTNKGSYIEAMWRKEKREFVKLHIVADRKAEDSRVQSDLREDRGHEVRPHGQGGGEEEEGGEGLRRRGLRLEEELQPPPGARD